MTFRKPRHLPCLAHLDLFSKALLGWFERNRRPLPWRATYDPYGVWISEIMLQQTQMERAVAFYNAWMERFPDLATLAKAGEEEVLKAWEGLGYYGRARNILRAARLVAEEYGGRFPEEYGDILSLPGVGPYTAAAISSIAFARDVACVDANVTRVVSRLLDVDLPMKSSAAKNLVAAYAGRLLPKGHAREHNQAMMELGALVCTKRPGCDRCPVAAFCACLHLGVAEYRPVAGPRRGRIPIAMATGVLVQGDRSYVQKRRPGDVWGGLWEFPGGCVEAGEKPEETVVREYGEETGFHVAVVEALCLIRHAYTRYDVTMHCFALSLEGKEAGEVRPAPPFLAEATEFRWATRAGLEEIAMPAAHRKLADRMDERFALLPDEEA